jgi:hypothetical protein
MSPRTTDRERLAADLELLGILGDPTRGPLAGFLAPTPPAPRGAVAGDTTRGARPLRHVLATLGRRTVIGTLLGVVLPRRAIFRDATAGDAPARERQAGGPGPVEQCSKLGGRCAVNGDCCGPGTRCKRGGNGECRCKKRRTPCAGICCPVGQACCGRCTDLQTDANNCGACFVVCGTDQTCAAGTCTT